ncbi:MAG: hypothetical protein ACERKN_16840 [Velocimicrobium sp.]
MARKKIIFVIVEGPSDEEALGVILSKIFNSNAVYVHIMRCDITTQNGNTPSNVINKVCDEIKQYARDNHFNKIHFQEIIHLVDTDGAYISEELVIEDNTLPDHVYSPNIITTPNKQGITQRNVQKSANLNKLASRNEIWELPYQIYYMSCNLDHVLYDKINSTNAEKERDSFHFAKQYKADVQGFLAYICESDFSIMTDYKQSWEYIKTDSNSLKRYTNLGLCFNNLPE